MDYAKMWTVLWFICISYKMASLCASWSRIGGATDIFPYLSHS